MNQDNGFELQRASMVDYQLRARGIGSPLVLEAMGRVPRERFIPERMKDCAYDDGPLPIGAGQTISQPYIVALMTEALDLEGGERVLDIGTGSGYAAAVLGCIASEVFSIERVRELADRAARTLAAEGFDNVRVRCGDGTIGWSEHQPFDGIIVAAGAPSVPESLKHQLAVGGHLVIPVGSEHSVQSLERITRLTENEFRTEDLGAVRFVPLIGEQGWS
ncbi:protein-L-isoaspartate(D-aspartate) O-methyltransferase [Marinobacter sp. DSM 26671]|jgi:protein-L-isoaspartate(D-aspartate) O-methyltransferase|uniref:Protein-L-isoaspartate O-methyltransferase n=1 Tax=Marinobacter flavimaris TaxID=262076 RepID=A0A3D8H6G0_9GAMM|nr:MULTISPECIES: protein-L-isoaspartate(D-aspartate) O-methyltransferase [Marinobacter]MCW9008606.1 protein-L-isoaspartate(D-aspartate) O-methyltransferase [Marinobacter sp.]HCA13068.1 protein-L-isoaspartate(D-aspartate) O-methyltransferase [Marinobacter adhaerens]AKV95306.1 protein-L-isoaspartate O-methyltransferase [Marinobacter sp. CP1]PPI81719.1 protein-L-isoaspartate(D-aspartate) O-methyltransferase [Marinobacter flavimaris]RDU42170.1 protein-L-isoaspartate(D-aspartate) O-methyltransferas|tara:strand:- start:685 stop:1341 length:657 start_codon:yes stop_codon:yes gene_type:complete